jgi:hypothetical protein
MYRRKSFIPYIRERDGLNNILEIEVKYKYLQLKIYRKNQKLKKN